MSSPNGLAGQVPSTLDSRDFASLFGNQFSDLFNDFIDFGDDEAAVQNEPQQNGQISHDQFPQMLTAADSTSFNDQHADNQHPLQDEGYNTQPTEPNWETQIDEDSDDQELEPFRQSSPTDDDTATLIRLLNKHKDNNTLSKIFTEHPQILGNALESLEDDDGTLFRFLFKHEQIVGMFLEHQPSPKMLADFLTKYPALLNVILDEEHSIVENFLRDHPDTLSTYLTAKNPTILNDFIEANPETFHADKHAIPKILSEFCDKYPKFMAVWLKNKQIQNDNGTAQAIADADEVEATQNTGDAVEAQGTQQAEAEQEVGNDGQESQDAQEEQSVQEIRPEQDDAIPSIETEQDDFIPGCEASETDVPESSKRAVKNKNKDKSKATDRKGRNKRRQKKGMGNKRPTRTAKSIRHDGDDDDQSEARISSEESDHDDDDDSDFAPSKPQSRAVTRAQSRRRSQQPSVGPSKNTGKAAAAASKRGSARTPKSKNKPRQAKPIPNAKVKRPAVSRDSDDDVEEYHPDVDSGAETDNSDILIAPTPAVSHATTSQAPTASSSSTATGRTSIPYPAPAAALAADALKNHGPRAWSLLEEDCGIKHMLAIRDEGVIKGEKRFVEAANRMNAELGTNRVGTSFKNFWNRAGRARSGYDERRSRQFPLATSLQDKATKAKQKLLGVVRRGGGRRKKAVVKKDDNEDEDDDNEVLAAIPEQDEEDENEEEQPERGTRSSSSVSASVSAGQKRKSEDEDEEFEPDSDARAFSIGTRQKKRVKYTY